MSIDSGANIDLNTIKNYISSVDVDENELKIFLKLYTNYYFFKDLKNGSKKAMNDLEDKVYEFDGYTLNDAQRIELEKAKIIEASKKIKDKKVKKIVENKINELEKLPVGIDSFDNYNFYIKKEISELQALVDLDIKFYEAAYVLFLTMYDNINKEMYYTNNRNNKK